MSARFWSGRSVLVTGATGLVGAHLCRALCDAGAEVTAQIRDHDVTSLLYQEGTAARLTRCVTGCLTDEGAVRRAFRESRPDTVFHLGAQTQVGLALEAPLETFRDNVLGTANVVDAARSEPGLRVLVFASSDKAYGTSDALPYTEDTPLAATFPYDVSKRLAEEWLRASGETYDVPYTIARCGNIFGGGDLNWERLIPGTIRSLASGQAPQIRSDGTFLRDYIFVGDVVHAYLTLAEAGDDEKVRGQAFNFGYGEPISVLDVVARIQRVMGTAIEPVILGRARGEIPNQYLSSQKARHVLGWEPKVAFDEGLAQTVRWYLDHLARRAPKGANL